MVVGNICSTLERNHSPPSFVPSTITVTSDDSGQCGCGAWCQRNWFQFEWPAGSNSYHIAFKELFAALLSCVIWGTHWKGNHVQLRCDNQAAVHAVSSRSCKDRSQMHLLQCLFFCEAHYQFRLTAVYLPGILNGLADDLSRNHRLSFLSKANKAPSSVPTRLSELLSGRGGDGPIGLIVRRRDTPCLG